jgi:hypothetical protein
MPFARTQGTAVLHDIPNITGGTEIPSLTPFPDFSMDVGRIGGGFDLGVKPRGSTTAEKPARKLNFQTSDQMKNLRQELERDFNEFSARIKKLSVNEPLKLDPVEFPEKPFRSPEVSEPREVPSLQQQLPPGRALTMESHQQVQQDEGPGFSTTSQFLLPDGSIYVDSR